MTSKNQARQDYNDSRGRPMGFHVPLSTDLLENVNGPSSIFLDHERRLIAWGWITPSGRCAWESSLDGFMAAAFLSVLENIREQWNRPSALMEWIARGRA